MKFLSNIQRWINMISSYCSFFNIQLWQFFKKFFFEDQLENFEDGSLFVLDLSLRGGMLVSFS